MRNCVSDSQPEKPSGQQHKMTINIPCYINHGAHNIEKNWEFEQIGEISLTILNSFTPTIKCGYFKVFFFAFFINNNGFKPQSGPKGKNS